MATTRRTFLRRTAATAGGAALAAAPAARGASPAGLGLPQEDPGGLIDLPRGFRYRVVQVEGESRLSNGAPVPSDFDGMAAFRGPRRGTTLLVRNHELHGARDAAQKAVVHGRSPYRAEAIGGTTGVVVDRSGRAQESYVTSSGRLQNCAGGATPWGTWITCEETRDAGHGFCFEVDPRDPESALSRTPITGMGVFSHEAIDLDPRTGIAYLTEDDFQGEIPDEVVGEGPESRVSFLYRFLPTNRAQRPGALQEGGRLQVMALDFLPAFNVDLAFDEDRFGVVWHDVDPADPRSGALAAGAARFQRLEGSHFAGGAFWFDDTAGGEGRHGQVFRLLPSGDPGGGGRDRLELYLESDDTERLDSPDNLVVTPWGDVWLAEDGDGIQRVMGITPEGETYEFARNRLIRATGSDDASEFCGPTFSPDGRTFYLNVQSPGHTFAIAGRGAPPRARLPRAAPPLRATGLPGAARAGRASAHHPVGGGRRTASGLRPESGLVGAPGAIVGPLPSQRTKRRSPWPT
jgi:secreted PhoX family phosphatase